MRNDIEGVAFDLDGTLYPNYRLNIRLLPLAVKEIPFLTAFSKVRKLIRIEQKNGIVQYDNFYKHQAELTARLLDAPPELIKEKIDVFIYRGWEPLFKKIKPFKNVLETLTALRGAGYKLGLLSDFPPEKKIEYLGLSSLWDAVHCSEYSGALKPHPLSFVKIAEQMKLSPEKILYVGNSVSYDVAGASNAGMKTAWIRASVLQKHGKKGPKPDFSFSNYRQLSNYMLH